jgi:UDP-N-acetylglucosamine pyrophosphorylase
MKLEEYKQEHLLNYKNELSKDELIKLETEINNIDFDLIKSIYNNLSKQTKSEKNIVEPIVATELNNSERKHLFNIGLESIKNGEVAVVLMAGGQGTRLGHKGPKGTFDIGLPSGKSLFHLQCDKLISLGKLTGTFIKWYIMTSEDNHIETVNHFSDNKYFGYSKEHIVFFKQDRLPLILEDGKIALKSKGEINLAANGNGGVFSSLSTHGLLDEMKSNEVKWVYLYGVDNAIAKVADPTFVGFTIESGKLVASKSVDKSDPEEKVGVICYRDGHPDIVEYSELTDELRYEKDADGRILYRNGNILSHIFSLDFLSDCVNQDIPYHAAHKKVSYFENGDLIESIQPNGYKFELFLFDMFKFTDEMAVLSVNRAEEFSPVKNKDGNDSPESARKMILEEHKNWLNRAGYKESTNLEVDTSITYQGENLENSSLSDITISRLT